jgi:hypothetical protein
MTKPLKLQQHPYELARVAYQAARRDWIDQLSLYPEYQIRAKPSDFLLKFLHAVLPEFKAHLFAFENQLVHFGQRTKYQQPEPAIPVTFDADELNAILLGATQTFDNQVGILSLSSKVVSTQQVAAIDSSTFFDFQALQHDDAAVVEDLLHFCSTDPEMNNAKFVANIQRYQQNRFPCTRAQLSPNPCLFGPCSRTRPANICCLCRGSHTIGKCYHITGIPECFCQTSYCQRWSL